MTDRRPMVRMVRSFMHRHPRRQRGLASIAAIMAPIALFLMVALVPVNLGSRAVVAGTGPLAVDGHVNSSAGSPVNGATVTVTVLSGTTVKVVMPTTTDVNGFYTVSVYPEFWDVGYTIEVSATYGSDTGLNSTTITDPFAFEMTIDVKLGTTTIPELGTPAIVALTVSVVGAMVVMGARRHGRNPI